jgi:hypothetical protein
MFRSCFDRRPWSSIPDTLLTLTSLSVIREHTESSGARIMTRILDKSKGPVRSAAKWALSESALTVGFPVSAHNRRRRAASSVACGFPPDRSDPDSFSDKRSAKRDKPNRMGRIELPISVWFRSAC